jgi:DNA-binding CsgD family transcriptional regulator
LIGVWRLEIAASGLIATTILSLIGYWNLLTWLGFGIRAELSSLEAPSGIDMAGPGRQGLAGLTPREREVLALMAAGHSNTAIGERLFIGGKTVETHIGTIFSKLELFPDHDVDRRVRAVLAFPRT